MYVDLGISKRKLKINITIAHSSPNNNTKVAYIIYCVSQEFQMSILEGCNVFCGILSINSQLWLWKQGSGGLLDQSLTSINLERHLKPTDTWPSCTPFWRFLRTVDIIILVTQLIYIYFIKHIFLNNYTCV